jgi:hypothetical protein
MLADDFDLRTLYLALDAERQTRGRELHERPVAGARDASSLPQADVREVLRDRALAWPDVAAAIGVPESHMRGSNGAGGRDFPASCG